jgi:hypothetical protein
MPLSVLTPHNSRMLPEICTEYINQPRNLIFEPHRLAIFLYDDKSNIYPLSN